MPKFSGALAPLNLSDYRKLVASNFLWWAARFMEATVVGWLVLELTNSAWQVALIGFYRMLPFLIIGFISGPIIDRYGRRRVIVWSQTVNFLASAAVAALLLAGQLAYWHLVLSALLVGAAWAVDWPARRAIVPDLVGRSLTIDAMLIEYIAQNLARIAGPFAGGSLIAATGVGGAYSALAAMAGLTLLLLTTMSKQPLPRSVSQGSARSHWLNFVAGLRYVRHSQSILAVLSITMIMNMLVFPYMTLLPVFARDVLHQGPMGLGILGAAPGAGAFFGLYLINRSRNYLSQGWIFAGGSLLNAVVLIIFAGSTLFWWSVLLLFLGGIGQAGFGTMQSAIILLASSDDMRSRAMGTLTLAIGAGPLGQLQIGVMAEAMGASVAVRLQAIVATIAILATIVAFPDCRKHLRETDSAPGERKAAAGG